MTKVSVVIPCYNQGQYIDEAVESVLSQTFQDYEIIIVNDGSTDDFTNEILKNYNKPKTTVIHTKNQGLSAARNNGIRSSNGEYILPLDADDKIGSDFIQKTIQIIQNDIDIKAVSSYVQLFGDFDTKPTPQGGTIKDFLHYNNTTATSLYRKKDYLSIGGYDESYKSGYEDWDFWLRLLKGGGKIVMIPEFIFFYRKKAESMLIETEKNHLNLYKKIIDNNIDTYKLYFEFIILKKEEILLQKNKSINELQMENYLLKKQLKQIENGRIIKTVTRIKRLFNIK